VWSVIFCQTIADDGQTLWRGSDQGSHGIDRGGSLILRTACVWFDRQKREITAALQIGSRVAKTWMQIDCAHLGLDRIFGQGRVFWEARVWTESNNLFACLADAMSGRQNVVRANKRAAAIGGTRV